jgi:hypothetical protein
MIKYDPGERYGWKWKDLYVCKYTKKSNQYVIMIYCGQPAEVFFTYKDTVYHEIILIGSCTQHADHYRKQPIKGLVYVEKTREEMDVIAIMES